jgi:uncharacterized protein
VSRITVIGGTGYAGSAIVAEAAARGHQVTALSRSLPGAPGSERIPHGGEPAIPGLRLTRFRGFPNVTYVQGDATDEAALWAATQGAGRDACRIEAHAT